MDRFRDFFYNKNDIVVALVILVIAAAVIFFRINSIMSYPEALAESQKQPTETSQPKDATKAEAQ